jgi:hypothetical protein
VEPSIQKGKRRDRRLGQGGKLVVPPFDSNAGAATRADAHVGKPKGECLKRVLGSPSDQILYGHDIGNLTGGLAVSMDLVLEDHR